MRMGRWALGIALFLMLGWANAEPTESPATRSATIVEIKKIPFTTTYELSREVGAGRMRKMQDGAEGKVVNTYAITYRGDKIVKKQLLKSEKSEAQNTVYLMGKAGFQVSRGGNYIRHKTMTMEATAYDPSAGLGAAATGRTKTGRKAAYGVVAVDPRVIPLNTLLFVEGYGFALACDTGSAIKGNKIDLCFNTYAETVRFGRRQVTVHILKTK